MESFSIKTISPIVMVEPDAIIVAYSTGAVAIATVALAIITYFYMRETRLIRVIGQNQVSLSNPMGATLLASISSIADKMLAMFL
jgi:hypothetical protein